MQTGAATTKRVFLVTGANTGLGFKASLDLAHQSDAHVIMTGRSKERVEAAAERVRSAVAQADPKPSSTIETALLDLSSLESVRAFCTSLQARSPPLTDLTILCNGAVNLPCKKMTVDALETIFAVNHLGHFLLVTTLLPITKRVVVVSSEVHDSALNGPSPPPNVSDLEQLARGYEPFIRGVAYTTSKLCNVLFSNELARRHPDGPEVIAYTPAFTPDTQLARYQDSSTFSLPKILAFCAERGIRVSNAETSGALMAQVCASDWVVRGWTSGMYIRVDAPTEPSQQARDPELAAALWELSERLVASKRP